MCVGDISHHLYCQPVAKLNNDSQTESIHWKSNND